MHGVLPKDHALLLSEETAVIMSWAILVDNLVADAGEVFPLADVHLGALFNNLVDLSRADSSLL